MDLPRNLFKARLKAGTQQIGMWNMIGGNTVPEMLAGAGYDWVLVDCEHAPVDTLDVLPALQAIGQYPDVSAVVRPAANDPVLFKRLLDIGAQTLLVPYVQSAEEARAAVSAMRYGPRGIRGMAGAMRATRYGRVTDYFTRAEEELCLILQVETQAGVDALDEIAAVDGVDGIFIGPADLSASMGYPGQLGHPEVRATIDDVIRRLQALGMPSGILSLDPDEAAQFMALGTRFTAVGIDLTLLTQAAAQLRQRF
ncbi:4-hydroxy-2-oxo-heptane-1,7-dioate aldolase [Roseivivax sp. THAF40]|uniref:HpcH/HpaI aldolase family protein n=1 Tax=unclassified Roseivivax TaxID=2639302 RepID=UPI001268191D|nr:MULTISPECIES: aldolase/citrate lyase family protein [unclassified Roseivivax]QFS82541.1 4-hydroxy-2-oxo-heptane-1,7-dioate aldolase [Roseivivax sp. THAF197b]QFT46310.1 4-hydroxy-2-oxo-heptane-1,7-dioate aldolase [Roseivivax sp. THAF40]